MGVTPDLQGQRLFVTGAGSGIGLSTVRSALARGARVACLARGAEEAALLAPLVGEDRVIERDLLEDGAEELAALAASRLDGLDGVVTAAGMFDHRPGLDASTESFERTLALNLTASFAVARDAGRVMARAGRGSIVLVSSQVGLIGHPRAAAYAASKAGVNGLAKALALELAPRGVRVNAVAPGPIATPMTQIARDDAQRRERLLASIPLGRFGEAHEVASAILFLLSEASSFITGHILLVDGGVTAA